MFMLSTKIKKTITNADFNLYEKDNISHHPLIISTNSRYKITQAKEWCYQAIKDP